MGGPGSGRKPREYPPELVETIRRLYTGGLTIQEVQAEVGRGVKVRNVLIRHGVPIRRAVSRDQSGDRGHGWKGEDAGYQALHLRVDAARGKPQHCERCGRSDPGMYEWANLTGRYHDVSDYARMCRSCHRLYDAARRRATGQRTVPARLQKGGGHHA